MKVVLLEDSPTLGTVGDIKEVSDGYARNYLLPRKLAAPATPQEIARAEARKRQEERRRQKEEAEVRALAQKMEGQTFTLKAKAGAGGHLFGSITNFHIAEALSQALGVGVDRRKIPLEEPIKEVGTYELEVHLLGDLRPKVKIVVEGEEGGEAAAP